MYLMIVIAIVMTRQIYSMSHCFVVAVVVVVVFLGTLVTSFNKLFPSTAVLFYFVDKFQGQNMKFQFRKCKNFAHKIRM